jgi:hypothetical protein
MKELIIISGLHSKDMDENGPYDWKTCYESLKTNYLDLIGERDIYLVTYSSPFVDELLATYKPKGYLIYGMSEFKQRNQISNFADIMKIVENKDQYGRVLMTRFDLIFKQPLNKWKVVDNKINLTFNTPLRFPPGDTVRAINDVLILFNIEYYDYILNKLKAHYKRHDKKLDGMHHIYHFKKEWVNYMFKGRYYSDTDKPKEIKLNDNPMYILFRKKRF